MFATTSGGGLNFGIPDVCKIPPNVPVPFPNFASNSMATGVVYKVILGRGFAHTVGTTIPLSSGDNPGVLGGVVYPRNMGPRRHTVPVRGIIVGNKPPSRLSGLGLHNQINVNGTTIIPGQFKVLFLK
ncbi:PAAR-like domain-containing protein [Sorangium sp. So ce726]|uniref:PAAR-like domain-containing protein n=1 Tax=Sorangium sp. So ce726 TaxID=3133319 RepID=UPI003F62B04C